MAGITRDRDLSHPYVLRLALKKRYGNLIAWGKNLSDVKFRLRRSYKIESTGRADATQMIVTAGTEEADAHATLLHELAHTSCFRNKVDYGHGEAWKETFIAAATEVVGFPIEATTSDRAQDVHESVRLAFSRFLCVGAGADE